MTQNFPNGSIVHVEYISRDPPATAKFYEKLLGWKITPAPEMNYTMFEGPGGPGGGIRKPEGPEQPATVAYVQVADLARTVKDATLLGGKVLLERQEVPGMGVLAVVQVPGGLVQGFWQPTSA